MPFSWLFSGFYSTRWINSPVPLAVETAVAERQDEVGCDHENIGDVEKHHIAQIAENEFPGQSAEIARNDKHLKRNAFPLRRAGAKGLCNIERPGKPKADEHACFQNVYHARITGAFQRRASRTRRRDAPSPPAFRACRFQSKPLQACTCRPQ